MRSSKTQNIICGYSGHAFVVLETAIAAGIVVDGYSDLNESVTNPYNLEFVGNEFDVEFQKYIDRYNFILGVGNNQIRRKIFSNLESRGASIVSVVHPTAILSTTVKLGNGIFISAGVIVNAQVVAGKGIIINTGSVIEHGCRIGDFTHIAPNAVLAGDVVVGDNSFIGANSVVIEGVKIGSGVFVGAGSVIINDIKDHQKVVGNPGRII